MKNLLLLLMLFLSYSVLVGQESDKDTDNYVDETLIKDQSRQSFLNDPNNMASLSNNGAFYVSNPSPSYKVDMVLSYHNPEWQQTTVSMSNGDKYDIMGRYRVIDQAFEVLHKKEAYELKKDQLLSLMIGEDRFLMMPDPMLEKRGVNIYQLHFGSDNYQLIEHHSAQWQDPPEQNMFDTREQHRTIKRKAELLLRVNGEFHQIKNNKDAFRVLSIPKKGETAGFIRKNKLKLSNADDLVRVLEFLEN